MKDKRRQAARTVAPKQGKAKSKARGATVAAIGPAFAGRPDDDAATLAELHARAADAKSALARLAGYVHDVCDAHLMILAPDDATEIFALAGYVAQRTARAFADNAHAICKALARTADAGKAQRGRGKRKA